MTDLVSFCTGSAVINCNTVHIGVAVLIGFLSQSHLARIGSSLALATLMTLTFSFLRGGFQFYEATMWFLMAFSGILVISYVAYAFKCIMTKIFPNAFPKEEMS